MDSKRPIMQALGNILAAADGNRLPLGREMREAIIAAREALYPDGVPMMDCATCCMVHAAGLREADCEMSGELFQYHAGRPEPL